MWLQAEGRGPRARVPGGALGERPDEAMVVGGEQLRADPARREDLEGRDRPDPVPGAAARAARQRARRRAPGRAVLPAHDRARLARHPQPTHPVRDRRARPSPRCRSRPRRARPARVPRRSCDRCCQPPEPERGQRAPLLHRCRHAGMRCSCFLRTRFYTPFYFIVSHSSISSHLCSKSTCIHSYVHV